MTDDDDEPVYPGTCRDGGCAEFEEPAGVNWRFRVPDGEAIEFTDLNLGRQRYVAGKAEISATFWSGGATMFPPTSSRSWSMTRRCRITEVVRGADLLKSTARQLLLMRALGYASPDYFHCELVRDRAGLRLAKRHDALSIRHLRESGLSAQEVLGWPVGHKRFTLSFSVIVQG